MDDQNMYAYGEHYAEITEAILRDVCELEPANPSLNDTICVDVSDLKIIVDRALRNAQVEAAATAPLLARIARLEAIEAAARNLVKVKGRYHTEQAFKALAALVKASTQETP